MAGLPEERDPDYFGLVYYGFLSLACIYWSATGDISSAAGIAVPPMFYFFVLIALFLAISSVARVLRPKEKTDWVKGWQGNLFVAALFSILAAFLLLFSPQETRDGLFSASGAFFLVLAAAQIGRATFPRNEGNGISLGAWESRLHDYFGREFRLFYPFFGLMAFRLFSFNPIAYCAILFFVFEKVSSWINANPRQADERTDFAYRWVLFWGGDTKRSWHAWPMKTSLLAAAIVSGLVFIFAFKPAYSWIQSDVFVLLSIALNYFNMAMLSWRGTARAVKYI